MSAAVDAAARAHAARLPAPTGPLLRDAIAPDAPDAWVRDVLLAYARHFVRRFDLAVPRDEAEAVLVDDVARLAAVPRTGDDDPDLEAAEAAITQRMADRGLQFLGGRTPPELGPYVWKRTEVRRFSVTLPRAEPQEVTVHLMHEFLLRGWLHWRTLGDQGAGGWYQQGTPPWPDGLYAVAERYPEPREENRSFTVSLLGHEAQHVADHHEFPGMASPDLEYRAKLVELIGYDRSEDRLDFFLSDAVDDLEQPHPWAAHRIVEDLAASLPERPTGPDAWRAVPYDDIRRLALELLDEDTARRRASA